MARKVDITEKSSLEGSPSSMIKGKVTEVNADAPAMLKVMNPMFSDDPGVQDIMDAYDTAFPGKFKIELEKLKLDFKDPIIMIQEAMQPTSGVGEPTGGEQ